MDVNKNTYTFSFAIIMVILVAAILSITFIQLKPLQDKNIELEKKQNILSSIGVNILRDSSEIVYPIYIKEEILINSNGEVVNGSAFDVDLSVELKKEKEKQVLPLFISEISNEIKSTIRSKITE